MAGKRITEVPVMTTDEEAEALLAQDLSGLDFTTFKPMRFEDQAKSERVNMRFPKSLLDSARALAEREGIPYQRFIRRAVETAVEQARAPKRKRA